MRSALGREGAKAAARKRGASKGTGSGAGAMTVTELRREAARLGIEGRSKMGKAQLIRAVGQKRRRSSSASESRLQAVIVLRSAGELARAAITIAASATTVSTAQATKVPRYPRAVSEPKPISGPATIAPTRRAFM